MKINILGWYNRNNCGDQGFLYVFQDIFRNHNLTFTTDNIIDDADFYILGGGDVAKSYYLRHLESRKYIALGIGLGYEGEIELLKSAEMVFFRNQQDVNLAKKYNIEAEYIPDLCFLLEKETKLKNIRKKKTLGIILSDDINASIKTHRKNDNREFFYAEYFKWEVAETLDYLSEWYDIVFIPFSHNIHAMDNRISYDVQARMKKAQQIITDIIEPNHMINLLSQCDLVMSMKFHGLIFSTISHTPFINIGLTRKTHLFCTENNLNNLSLEAYSLTKSKLLDVVKKAEIDSIREKLKEVSQRNREVLITTLKQYRDILPSICLP